VPAGARTERRPVLSLMPAPGDVDVVIAAELMEAGRAIQRGLVTPDRTLLISSSHRSYAVIEKSAPGDGIAESSKVYEAAKAAAKRFIAFDMAALAEGAGSVISAVLLGALAGSEALPFSREAYEATIRAAGVGVEPSLRAFERGFEQAAAAARAGSHSVPETNSRPSRAKPVLAPVGDPAFDALVIRASANLPPPVHDMTAAGLRAVVDFQDTNYGGEYLDLVESMLALDRAAGGAAKGFVLTRAAAKYIAVAMAYDDVVRVADLKTRASRFARVRHELAAKPHQLVYTTEFMHPRMEEVAGSLPLRLGTWIETRPRLFQALDRLVNRGRRVRTGTVGWFLVLYLLAGLKRFRRSTLRHARETQHRDGWLAHVHAVATMDYALAVEIVETRRLVKGYSDTHARGRSKFDKVMNAARRLEGRPDAAAWVRRLREAALRDEGGDALQGALATVDSFL
jgi:indolepyruvate ferredoxin oxidoreductase beta subunit